MLAWVLVRDRFWGKRLLDLVIDVPFALPTIVAGLVLLTLYGPKSPLGALDFGDFLKRADGQKVYAETGYRPRVSVGDLAVVGANDPSDPFPAPETLLTIDKDFGGWSEANTKYFDEKTGIVTKLLADSGKA
jgi:hypothetical protein